jgi:inorganic pyrophosphatase
MGKKDKEYIELDIVIETPKHSRNKYAYNKKKQGYELKKILPAGAMFPFDFGFIPGTVGGDGDPVDVLVIMDEPAFPGCFVRSRIIGALKAEQSEKEKMKENNRIVAVSTSSRMYEGLKDIKDLDANVKEEITHFFVSYNEVEGKKFIPKGWADAAEACKIIRKSQDK